MVNVKNYKILFIYFYKFIYFLFDSIVIFLFVILILIFMIKKRKWENCMNSFFNKNKKIIKSVICNMNLYKFLYVNMVFESYFVYFLCIYFY